MEIVIRASLVFGFLWLVMRGLGKRELSEMNRVALLEPGGSISFIQDDG